MRKVIVSSAPYPTIPRGGGASYGVKLLRSACTVNERVSVSLVRRDMGVASSLRSGKNERRATQ